MIYAQEFINNNDTYLWTYTDANGNIITSLDYPSGIENISNIIPPTYSMTQDGDTVIVILTTLNNHGCVQGTDSVQVITIADPVAHFVVDTTQGCHPFTIQTDTTAISSNGIYTWIVSINGNTYDSISTTGYSTPSFTLTNTDNLADSTYTISLTVGDPNDCDSTYIIDNIIVNPVPQASFTTVPTSACADTTIQVNNNSIGNGMTWLWSVNPSLNTIISDSSATEPDFYFPDNQSGSDIIYSISLEVTSDQGCQNTITVDDTIHTRPIALFSINDNTCGPDTISPTNNSSFANGYLWSISSSSNPATIVNTTGFEPNIIIPENNTQDSIVYTLILTAITDNGCQDTDTNIVTVYPTPLASAIPSAIDSCGPFVVNFNNISTPYNQEDITSMNFEWYVDGVLINTTQNFTHTFNSAAFNDTTYLVELYATSQHDCFDDTSFTITVYPDPIATIVDTGSLIGCEGLTIDENMIYAQEFINNNDTYLWTYTDANGNIITSLDYPSGIENISNIIPPTYSMTQDGDTVIVILTTLNNHGCVQGTDSVQVITIADPVAHFVVDTTQGCHPFTIQTDTTAISSNGIYTWIVSINGNTYDSISTTGYSTPSFTLTNTDNLADSTYTISLTVGDPNDCDSTYIIDNIIVNPVPQASFTTVPTSACADTTIQVNNNSIGNGMTWLWSVNPSLNTIISDSSATEPDFYFPDNQSGSDIIYSISLEVTSDQGCQNTITVDDTIHTRPIALFSINDNTCGPDTISPTNNSSFANGYLWSISSSSNPATIVNTTGFEPNIIIPENNTQDSIVYTLILTAITDNGCQDTDTNIVTVYPTPLASAIPSAIDSCGPFVVNFNNISTPYNQEDITSMNFEWYVDGVLINTTQNFTHTFNSAAFNDTTYLVELYATSQHDCFDDTSFTITVYPDPIATIVDTGSLIGCEGLTIDENMIYAQEFINNNDTYLWTYTDANGNIITSLDYPSGIENISNIIPPTYSMTQDGDTVIVILTTLNNHGCVQGTDSVQVITIADPVAHFVVDTTQGCHPFTIQTDTTAISSNGIYTWIVSINGNTYDSISTTGYSTPSFTLTNTDNLADSTYTISLTVGDPNDCDSTYIIDNIIVNPVPQASFTTVPTSACADTTIQVNNNSIGNGMTWLWSVNPSLNTIISDSSATEPDFYFPDNQSGSDIIYSISLEVTSDQGCQNTITVDDTIHTRPIALFSINDNTCGPDTISPTNNSSFANGYLWSISSSSNPATIVNTTGFEPNIIIPENNTQDSIVYTLILTAITDNGCQDTDTNIVTVYPTPLASAIPSAIDSCGPFVVNFNNISTPYNQEDITSMNFEWYVDGVLINTTQNFIHTFNSAAFNDTTYLVELYATSQHDCFDDTSFTITVYPDPIATIVDTGSLIGCEGLTIDENMIYAQEFINNNDTYLWTYTDANGNIITSLDYPSGIENIYQI